MKYFLKKIQFIIILSILTVLKSYPQTGTVKGRVYDAVNNEPLPFVNVVVFGTNIGSATDVDGKFIITGIKPGFIQLTASFVGYKNAISREIKVGNIKIEYVDIPMEMAEQNIQEVVVTGNIFYKSEESPVSLRSIGLAEIERNPGANRDISKVIQSFPGIASSVSFRNDIIIRGGGPSETRFYLDGVEVPNINHFATQGASGGPVGIINADFINEVNYYSGAFPANKGNALSGILDFKQITGNKDRLKFKGTLGASELSGTLDGPIGKKTTFIFSARQSYLQFLFDAIGLPFLPTFNDFQFKSLTRFSDKHELTIIGIGAIDLFKLNTGIKNPNEEQQFILSYLPVYQQWNYTIGAVYKYYRKNSYQTFVVSRNHLNNTSYKYINNDESKPENKILDYNSQEIENKLRYEVTNRSGDVKINYGANLELARYTNNTFQKRFQENSLKTIEYNVDLDFLKYGTFGQISKDVFNNRLSLSFGIRMDGNNYSSSFSNLLQQFSPRFSVSYILTKSLNLSFNTGRYFQLPAYTTLGYQENGKFVNKENNLKYISVDHLIAGFEYKPNEVSQFTIEGFYKKYSKYPFSISDSMSIANKGADFGVIGDEEVVSKSNGRAYGMEFQFRLKTQKRLNVNVAYTLVRSEFEDKNGTFKPSSWDSKHILTLTGTKTLDKNWNIGFKWRFLGGLPYTPYDLNKSELIDAWNSQQRAFLDLNQLNSARLKPYHQLDVRVDKGYYFKRWSIIIYLDIQNLYNFKGESQDNILRVQDANGNYVTKDNNTRYVLKSISSTSGTVLPTIGITVEF
jgi:hypothetical protein